MLLVEGGRREGTDARETSSTLSQLLIATVSSIAWLTLALVSANASRAASLVARTLPCLPGALTTVLNGNCSGGAVCSTPWLGLRGGSPCIGFQCCASPTDGGSGPQSGKPVANLSLIVIKPPAAALRMLFQQLSIIKRVGTLLTCNA